jgi:uncharacterized protein (TIGR02145 family)
MKTILKIGGLFLLILSINLFNSCKKDKPTPPAINTTPVSEISYTTATSGGYLKDEGSSSVLSMGICWNTSPNPTIANSKTSENITLGTFVSNVTQLSQNTKYYLRAYATNSAGTSYGNELNFTTTAVATPLLTTGTVASITGSTAISGGSITSDNGGSITAKGVCWNTSGNPTIDDPKTTDGNGTDTFSSNISGLSEGTTYHVRAYATNLIGTAYGEDLSFSTLSRPTLTTTDISNITLTSAISGGNITSDGGASVTERGICWNTTPIPTIDNSKVITGNGIGSFISNIQNVEQGTTFYLRAFATNSIGTAYGNQVIFTTNISDFDGNVYHPVMIGTQVWMVENLKVTHYRNGDIIINAQVPTLWGGVTTGFYCNYNDDANNAVLYGSLYNWYAVNDTRNLCPTGWHVPSDSEWEVLGTFLGGDFVAGGKMKEIGLTHWIGMNVGADNSSGFTALPGGRRFDSMDTPFGNFSTDGFWWSSTEYDSSIAWSRDIYGSGPVLGRTNIYNKTWGLSVRCLRN